MKKLDISLLLIEDDTVIRNIYTQILGNFVSKLYVAANGSEGYDSYIENKPDLILTDIKMPVMNGLDMIKKIRENDKSMRIIIMSAFGESRFFINAIETGVKGFLIKPVDTEHLKNIIAEQAKDILLEKRLNDEENKRLKAESERDKGDAILNALLETTSIFFNKGVNNESINEALALIGNTTKVSRSYIFKVHKHKGKNVISHINEWVSKGIKPEIDNSILQNIPDDDPSYVCFAEKMMIKQNIIGLVDDFDEPLASIFAEQQIKSILSIPIFVNNIWWGFIGFDDCLNYRKWTDSEIAALDMLGYILGGAIYRGEVELELKTLNLSLEERVLERTSKLELEVAERIKAESNLKESEEKYRMIYENANDGIILLIDNVIELINPRVSEIFKSLPKNIIGAKLISFIKPEFHNDTAKFFEVNDSSDVNADLQIQLINDTWLEMKSNSILWDELNARLIFVSNISKRKQAEIELYELNENLEKRIEEEIEIVNTQQQFLVQKSKLESIGEVSAGLAHEINQPLGGISMGLENILNSVNSDEIDHDYLRRKIDLLFKDIERIRKIIEHVRLFSRDQDKSIFEKVVVNNVINNSLQLVNKQLTGRNINVVTNIPDKPAVIMGNQFRLEQVLLNVISNARHAVEDKEKHLTPENYSKRITIDLIVNKTIAEIVISDNGVGVDNSIIDKVFDPFFTTKSEEKGTGLGLSISYGIISELGGTIAIESEIGKYTNMIIKLPLI